MFEDRCNTERVSERRSVLSEVGAGALEGSNVIALHDSPQWKTDSTSPRHFYRLKCWLTFLPALLPLETRSASSKGSYGTCQSGSGILVMYKPIQPFFCLSFFVINVYGTCQNGSGMLVIYKPVRPFFSVFLSL